MADALRDAYGDIFLIKEHPTTSDRTAIEGKFKSFHNASDNVASLMAKPFMAMLPLADLSSRGETTQKTVDGGGTDNSDLPPKTGNAVPGLSGLHYNIQIHLPATKDVEVYNAIFKSLREHLLEQ